MVSTYCSLYAPGGANAVAPSAVEAAGFASTVTDGLPAQFNTENMAELEGAAAALMTDPAAVARLGGAGASDVAFINALYLAAFRRAALSTEVSAWQANFAAGWTRAGMVALFSEWHEHRALTVSATPNGVTWLDNVGQGVLSILPQASADGRTVKDAGQKQNPARRNHGRRAIRNPPGPRRNPSTRPDPRNIVEVALRPHREVPSCCRWVGT